MFLNQSSDLFEGCMGSVWNSNQKVGCGSSVSLFVINVLNTVDEDDAKVRLETLVVELKRVELLSNFLFEVGWLLSVFLNYLISSIEHVCFLS